MMEVALRVAVVVVAMAEAAVTVGVARGRAA